MEEAVRRAVEILNDKIRTNRLHDGEFTLVTSGPHNGIALYYTDRVRNHRICIILTAGGEGYDFFYAQLISGLTLMKTCLYETVHGICLEAYEIGELMRKGTYLYDSRDRIKNLKLV